MKKAQFYMFTTVLLCSLLLTAYLLYNKNVSYPILGSYNPEMCNNEIPLVLNYDLLHNTANINDFLDRCDVRLMLITSNSTHLTFINKLGTNITLSYNHNLMTIKNNHSLIVAFSPEITLRLNSTARVLNMKPIDYKIVYYLTNDRGTSILVY